MRNLLSSLFLTLLCLGSFSVKAATIYEPYTVNTIAGWKDIPWRDGVGKLARFDAPYGVITDSAGNLFVTDWLNAVIRKITPDGVVTTIAGMPGVPGSNDGVGSAARFHSPTDIAIDSAGNLYVVEVNNHTVRKITPDAVVTTLAGVPGVSGYMDGPGNQALFNQPRGVAADHDGNVFVADTLNRRIRKITPDGAVTTFAGSGAFGTKDGTGTNATFAIITGLGIDASDNLYVGDDDKSIRRISPTADVTHYATLPNSCKDVAIAPDGTAYAAKLAIFASVIKVPPGGGEGVDFVGGTSTGSEDGVGDRARFRDPQGVAVGPGGDVFVADGVSSGVFAGNNNIRKVTPGAVVTTFAGLAMAGSDDAVGNQAQFYYPRGMAVDNARRVLYVADGLNHTIRKIKPNGAVKTIAGLAGFKGSQDGTRDQARFNFPQALTVDAAGNVIVADTLNGLIRKVTPKGVVTTLANGATFATPEGVAAAPDGTVFVANTDLETIDRVSPDGTVSVFAGKTGEAGRDDGTGGQARFNSPQGIGLDDAGNIYVADSDNASIRKITPEAVVTTLAGGSGRHGNDDGTGIDATFGNPTGLTVDGAGNIYLTDLRNHTLRKIAPDGTTRTLAGKLKDSDWADGPGQDARFDLPWGVAVDAAGNVYVADSNNDDIRQATATD
jgi:sugar lactone lactonase YvrE